MKDLIYDIETYPNVFSITFMNADTGKIKVFEMSEFRNDWDDFKRFLLNCSNGFVRWVGFNNYYFDYPVVHFMYQNFKHGTTDGKKLARIAWDKAQRLIRAGKDDKFDQIIWDNNQLVQQVDLFRIHHFDNMARSTSLKVLEFNMRSDVVEDLPFDYMKPVTEEQKKKLLAYNEHDVRETFKFYKKSADMIAFREKLTEKYDKNFLNHNDTKIGKDYFIMELEKAGIKCYTYGDDGRKPVQTKREKIRIRDVILPYVQFERPEFNAVLAWLKRQEIKETKGVFTEIEDFDEIKDYIDHDTVVLKIKHRISGKISSKLLKTFKFPDHIRNIDDKIDYAKSKYDVQRVYITHLHVVIDGFQFDFGTGGIHGSIDPTIVLESEKYAIIDYDVTSLYPSIAIANELYPKHLTKKFCSIYTELFENRQLYPKGTPENAMLKLALNGVYGDSNNQFSPFYDPQYTMAITINGQLQLCMLAEQLMKIDDLHLIQINTDGVTIKVPRDKIDEVEAVNAAWMETTMLNLERADYKRMFIRDVNNYIGEYTDGELKRKGAYEYEINWHQNHSSLVVQKAVEAHLVRHIPIEKFIAEHDDVYDFFLRTKVPKSSRLMWGETRIQNTTRYYISSDGHPLVKVMPPLKGKENKGERHFKQHKKGNKKDDGQWNVTPMNTIGEVNNIDHGWYINEAKKLIEPLYDGLLTDMMT